MAMATAINPAMTSLSLAPDDSPDDAGSVATWLVSLGPATRSAGTDVAGAGLAATLVVGSDSVVVVARAVVTGAAVVAIVGRGAAVVTTGALVVTGARVVVGAAAVVVGAAVVLVGGTLCAPAPPIAARATSSDPVVTTTATATRVIDLALVGGGGVNTVSWIGGEPLGSPEARQRSGRPPGGPHAR
jgi:hypothetical protein